jgi:hypothetical protein|tara:strand:- start:448 stop:618 length:171 start_codon:yes stop_codon:yes gene_type:complete
MKDLKFIIGKYKGATLNQIWDCDESYVCWFLSNVDIPELEKEKALDEIATIKGISI